MKKLLLCAGVMFLFASLAMAQITFSPTIMEITSPEEIGYDFGGEPLDIPFTVSGVPGAFWLVINTHGKADEIVGVKNGFLGWHYVNNIDTTVYVSGRYQRELGDVKITWDGTNSDGAKVPEDTYSYHIWGYDDKSQPQLVSNYICLNHTHDCPMNTFVTHDTQGLVREKPFIIANLKYSFAYKEDADEKPVWKRFGTAYKWELGANPEDINNLETTWMPFYVNRDFAANYQYGTPLIDPVDNEWFYHSARSHISNNRTLIKWKFVPGGDAEQDMDYMGWDTGVEWPAHAQPIGNERPLLHYNPDGSEPYMYQNMSTMHIKDEQYNPMVCINFVDGEVVWRKELDEYFFPDDNNAADEINGCVQNSFTRGGNIVILNSYMACLQEVIDTSKIFEDVNTEDHVVWQNWNGDYFMDKWYWEGAETPWACLAEAGTEAGVSPFAYFDMEHFAVYGRQNYGTTNMTILSQDGTGVANVTFFGQEDTVYGRKYMMLDYGTQYDGAYLPKPAGVTKEDQDWGMWFVTFDSNGGLIVPGEVQPGVEEEAQASYALEQNAPNPFNPTTTIGFTLAETGNVTIDVYNVTGQKVDTLVSGFMDAGSHSVVWDASGFSAGVYFYTIKSGEFSSTMKMTLLK